MTTTLSGTQLVGNGFAQNGVQLSNATSSVGSAMGMNSFLTMFTTQLQYQDPTNPLQSYELAAQLAQFSTVEKLTEISSTMQQQESLLSSINSAQMVDTLGKNVVAQDDSLQVTGGVATSGNYQLSGDATVTAKVYDSNGVLVRTMSIGQQAAGNYQVSWDGKDDNGNAVGDGTYHFSVDAVDASGNSVQTATSITGKVFSFRMEDGVPYLVLDKSGGIKVPISEVAEVQTIDTNG